MRLHPLHSRRNHHDVDIACYRRGLCKHRLANRTLVTTVLQFTSMPDNLHCAANTLGHLSSLRFGDICTCNMLHWVHLSQVWVDQVCVQLAKLTPLTPPLAIYNPVLTTQARKDTAVDKGREAEIAHIANVHEDSQMSGVLVYFVEKGKYVSIMNYFV
jgi:hypothetical protein